MKAKPVALFSTDPREAGNYFTPNQLVRFVKLYGEPAGATFTLEVYSRETVEALANRIAELERALGGMLFDFDDGVNGGCSERLPSLDFARKTCTAVEFKKEATKCPTSQ